MRPQFVISDSIVVWRGWVLCRDRYRKTLFIPLFFLTLTTRAYSTSLWSNVSAHHHLPSLNICHHWYPDRRRICSRGRTQPADVPSAEPSSQCPSGIQLRVVTAHEHHRHSDCKPQSVVRTSADHILDFDRVYCRTRRFSRVIKTAMQESRGRTTQAEWILTLLIETGLLYCIFGVFSVAV